MAKDRAKTKFTLAWPPSLNVYYRHVGPRVLISAKGQEYRRNIIATIWDGKPKTPLIGPLTLMGVFRRPDRRRRDLDNLLKCICDSLTHAGVYKDDSQIQHIDIRFSPEVVEGGAVDVTLMPYKG